MRTAKDPDWKLKTAVLLLMKGRNCHGVGTEQFNKSLCRKLRINSIQASAILNDFSKADTDIAKALMALQDPYRDLVAEVNRSIQG